MNTERAVSGHLIQALVRWASPRGLRWKHDLMRAWETGFDFAPRENVSELMQLRNDYGYRWLAGYVLPWPHSTGTWTSPASTEVLCSNSDPSPADARTAAALLRVERVVWTELRDDDLLPSTVRYSVKGGRARLLPPSVRRTRRSGCCPDCGKRGETAGHQECMYPQNH